MAKVFISHAGKDKELAKNFRDFLRLGLDLHDDDIFCASEGDEPPVGRDLVDSIKTEMDSCAAVIFLITKNFRNCPLCLAEIGAAWISDKKCFPMTSLSDCSDFLNSTPLVTVRYGKFTEENGLTRLCRDMTENNISAGISDRFHEYLSSFLSYLDGGHPVRSAALAVPRTETVRDYMDRLEKAVSDGDPKARYLLGCALYDGVLVKRDTARSYHLISEAAWNDYNPARIFLGNMCLSGGYGKGYHNFGRALYWLKEAKRTDSPPELYYSLGMIYFFGLGCVRDLDAARKYLKKAGSYGRSEGYLSCIDSIRENDKELLFSTGREAISQSPALLCKVGDLYSLGGRDYEPDYENAELYYRRAFKKGKTEAGYRLGLLYTFGKLNFRNDYRSASDVLQKAADAGHAGSQYLLASLYQHELLEGGREKAGPLFSLAADHGHVLSHYELGVMDGQTDCKDSWPAACDHLTEAAERNYAPAQCLLGDVYRFGLLGRKADRDKAAELYQKSCGQGNAVAENRMKDLRLP